jgi:signal transduction histidine kinase
MERNRELAFIEEDLSNQVTAYHESQSALLETNQLLRTVLETLPVGVWVADREGNIVQGNPAGQKIWEGARYVGLERYGEYKGWWSDTGKRIEAEEWAMARALKGETSIGEVIDIECFDGTRKTILHSAVPLRNDREEIFGAIVLIQDITDRTRTEEEVRRLTAELEERVRERTDQLKAINEELQAIFSAIPDLFFRLDRDGTILDYKAHSSADLYAPPREFLGKRVHEVLPSPAGDEFQGALQRLRDTQALTSFEYSLPMPGGEAFYEARLFPIFDGQTIAIVRNITERRRAEEEIRMLNEDLQRRACELEGANRELESFSYSVSHDLRAPLRHIEGFGRALLEDCGERLDPDGKIYLQRILGATRRMGQLIDDMLKLASVTSCELARQPVNLSRLAQTIALELKQLQPERSAHFNIAEGVTANGDARLLRVVLANLLGNAWKYTGKREEAVIEFDAAWIDGEPTYFVRDNGAGFDMAYAGKLFGAFQRLHGVDEFEGSGIGLATVQRVIRRHGGRVWAEGEVGRGATLYFTLGQSLRLS